MKTPYKTLSSFKAAIAAMGIINASDYRRRRRLDPSLPRNPSIIYKNWKDWDDALGNKPALYSSYAQASKAAKKLGIKTSAEYQRSAHKDPKLPSTPRYYYNEEWHGWPEFLGTNREYKKTSDRFKIYQSLAQAKKAVCNLGITTCTQYYREYKADPMLPYSPQLVYSAEWDSWASFLGTDRKSTKNKKSSRRSPAAIYKTLSKASKAAVMLGAKTAREYISLYKKDPKLPSNPSDFYADWKGWKNYLGLPDESEKSIYKTLGEASSAASKLKILTSREYIQNYKRDPKLPSNPAQHYEGWTTWKAFLKV